MHLSLGRGGQHAEVARLVRRHGDRGNGDVGVAAAVEVGHLPHIHAVDMVGGEHRDQIGRVRLQEVEMLDHGVGGALELAAERIGARQEHLDGSFGLGEPRRPGRLDVPHQRLGLVLREHVDRRDSRID